MAATQRTPDEADNYIKETITYWINKGENKKVVSLAIIAEKWRSKTVSAKQKMIIINKNINSLVAVINRRLKMNSKVDNSVLEKELEKYKASLATYIEKYGELKPKKINKKLEKGIELKVE